MNKTLSLQDEFALALTPFNPVKGEHRDWRVQTVAGPLEVTLYAADGTGPWIACVFLDVEKARRHFGIGPCDFLRTRLNPCCGKFNWHWHEFATHNSRPSKVDIEAAWRRMVAAFFQEMRRTLVPGGNP